MIGSHRYYDLNNTQDQKATPFCNFIKSNIFDPYFLSEINNFIYKDKLRIFYPHLVSFDAIRHKIMNTIKNIILLLLKIYTNTIKILIVAICS